jgi:hypothetical protein
MNHFAMRRSPLVVAASAILLAAMTVGWVILPRSQEVNRRPARRDHPTSGSLPYETVTSAGSPLAGNDFTVRHRADQPRRRNVQSNLPASPVTHPHQSAGAITPARVTNEKNDLAVADEATIPNEAKALTNRPVFRLPLFYSLDNEKIAALIPGVTVAGLKVLKQEFEDAAGVGVLAPDDPVYAERWKQAELTLQQRTRLWYGWAAWGAFEHQAALQANAATEDPLAP